MSWKSEVIGGATWCEICGENELIIDPHHYIHKSQCPQLKDDIRNGIRLCRFGKNDCHGKAHSAGGKKFIADWFQKNRPADKSACDNILKEFRRLE